MGLDMFLTKKTYIDAKYKHRNVNGTVSLTSGEKNKPIPIQLNRIGEICEDVGYWRKANQIHKWFVDNVQEGVDNCGEYPVSEEQLRELLSICEEVKKDNSKAESLLPTQSGFFFGHYQYDEYYFNQIDDTIKILEGVLSETEEINGQTFLQGHIYYSSSW